jgi:hypothetical protein
MRIFTVHVRSSWPADDPDVALVSESFSWFALALPALFALWHRLWLGLAAYAAMVAALAGAAAFFELSGAVEALIGLGVAVVVGASANDWRRWTLERQGYRLVAVAAGRNLAEAEHRFFANWSGFAPRGGDPVLAA